MLGRVATECLGINAFGYEISGDLGSFFALVDEDEDTFEIDAVGGEAVATTDWCDGRREWGMSEDVLSGCFANGPDSVRASEGFIPAIRILFNVDDAELDAAGDGVEVWRDEATHVWEAGVEVGVEASGDGGGAENELAEGGGGFVDDGRGYGGEGSVEEGVGFVDYEVGYAGEDVGVGFGDAGEEVGG